MTLDRAIAIVGIGCRFPRARDADTFWSNIAAGKVAFSEIPKDRWNHDVFFSANQRDIDKSWTASGSFIDEYREFAALHYGIAPRRLEVMDPQQRLLIETTRLALQDAGYERRDFPRRRTGVYVGVSIAEFQQVTNARLAAMRLIGGDFGAAPEDPALSEALLDLTSSVVPIRAFTLSGSLTALAGASVAQTFDLGGPAYTLDSACASASLAVHDAVTQLRTGQVDAALAGGAYINLAPDNLVAFTKIGAISKSGVCRPFDHRADGFVQSDAVGVVMLKRLEDALADDDRIYAVIRGSASNNDGRGEGPMTPRTAGQQAVLHDAYADAGLPPTAVSFFEAHGTATSIGDPVEIEALGTTLVEAGATAEDPALIGSVKGNIGHAMSAAGFAGLVKAIKVLEHRAAPPQPGFERPHDKLGLDRFPLRVSDRLQELEPRQGALRVAVSSFGFGGTNSHIVLEEPPTRPRPRRVSRPVSLDLSGEAPNSPDRPRPEAVVVTAPNLALLVAHLRELADAIDGGTAKDASLADLAFTLNARRAFERVRAVIRAEDSTRLLTNLRAAADGLDPQASLPQKVGKDVQVFDVGEPDAPRPRVAFLFPGQGAQQVDLMADVRDRFEGFAEAFDRLAGAADRILPRPLASYVYPSEGASAETEAALRATEVCQPAMAALGLATAALLRSFGVEPDVSLGHSLGEFAALANAGVMSGEDAVRLVARRGAAMRALPHADTGTMAAVLADEGTVRGLIDAIEGVWVANVNHPGQVSISGTTPGVEQACAVLEKAGLDVRPLSVSHAFHTPLVDGVSDAVGQVLDKVEMSAPQHAVASCIAQAPHGDDAAATREVLMRHATAPVVFTRGLEQARDAGATVFVQVGAGQVLTSFTRATLGRETVTAHVANVEPDGGAQLIFGLGALAAAGVEVDFEAVYAVEGRRVVTLPETPLERQAYWPVKPATHPKAELEALELPAELRRVALAGRAAAPAAGKAASPDLVALFSEQTRLLNRTAEIIATQNRLLLGESGDVSDVQSKVAALLAEPQAAPAAAAAPTAAVPETGAKAAAKPAPAAREARDSDEVRARVMSVIAKVSAFPQDSLRLEQRLVDELGFDSLMVADLGGALQSAFPELPPLPPTLFSLQTTVDELVRHVVEQLEGGGEAPAADEAPAEDVPVSRYRVLPAARERGGFARARLDGETWLVTEDGSALASEVSAALAARGADLVRVRFTKDGVAAPSQLSTSTLNLWPEAFVEGLPEALKTQGVELSGVVHAAALSLADAADFENPVALLHPLAAALDVPAFVTLTGLGGRLGLERSATLTRNVLQGALSGYTKAMARERPHAQVRTFDLDPDFAPGPSAVWVVDEILGGDRAVEVGFDGRRWVPELAEAKPGDRAIRRLGKEDVVLVTGGTGEIGGQAAGWAAERGAGGVILVGRRPADAKIEAQLAALRAAGAKALYVACDVADKEAFRTAMRPVVQQLGPVTVVLHAAGIIEDARITNKSVESVERVMGVKVRGMQVILRTFPQLRDLVLFSSWAGRFGNAGQADYAAANDLLDRIAVTGAGAARVVSVVWPPWASTKMVQSIPEAVRKMMAAEGVTFLEDAEGLDVLGAVFEEGIRGVEIVGRALPARDIEARHTEPFTLARHPYLDDHRLDGRAVVPLASVTDAMGWTFRETAGREGPLTVERLELSRGVAAEDVAEVVVRGRRGGDAVTTAQIEVRVGEALAYRARASNAVFELPAAPELSGDEVSPKAELSTFYAEQTFHGPRFHGIERVERMTSDGVEGWVRTAPLSSWLLESSRSQWTADPLVLDASFQLAGYWLFEHLGRAGFPTGFDRLRLARPFGSGRVRARVVLRETDEQTFTGDIFYWSEAGQPLGILEGIQGRFASLAATGTKAPKEDTLDVPEASYKIGQFPELEELDQRFQMAELVGLKNPYFNLHSGTARDTSVVEGVEMLNYSSYNYLGFSGHPEVVKAAQDAIAQYGTSVSASRVASGERPIHRELEAGLARHIGVEAALVFVSGHATNVTTIGHLLDREDLVLHDALIHDSALQGIYLSGATRRPFPHNDYDALERLLSQLRSRYRRVLIVAEGIYSMDGDICDVPRLIELKKRFKTLLMVDEAHSIGVLGEAGRGIGAMSGIDPNDVDIWMGTMSKSFASCGGYIAGSEDLIRYLKYTAPGFVYSAGIPPSNAAAALKALELMTAHPEVVEQCCARSRFFLERAKARGLDTGDAIGAAVVPVVVGNSLVCVRLSENLAKRQINVQPIVYPAVEDTAARLRFFISATHTEAQLAHTVDVIVEELAKAREEAFGGAQSATL